MLQIVTEVRCVSRLNVFEYAFIVPHIQFLILALYKSLYLLLTSQGSTMLIVQQEEHPKNSKTFLFWGNGITGSKSGKKKYVSMLVNQALISSTCTCTFAVDGDCTRCFLRDAKKPCKDVVSGNGPVNEVQIMVSDTCTGESRCMVNLVVEPNHICDAISQEVWQIHLWRVTDITCIHHTCTYF